MVFSKIFVAYSEYLRVYNEMKAWRLIAKSLMVVDKE